MQALAAKLSGTPTVGDCVMLHWIGTLGGRTSAGYYVCENDTVDDILRGVIDSARNYFLNDQEVKQRDGGGLTIITSREDGHFETEVLGARTETFTIEVL